MSQKSLSATGGTEHKNITLFKLYIAFCALALERVRGVVVNALVVVVYRHAEHLFRHVLPDYIFVELFFYLLGRRQFHGGAFGGFLYPAREYLVANTYATVANIHSCRTGYEFHHLRLFFAAKCAFGFGCV